MTATMDYPVAEPAVQLRNFIPLVTERSNEPLNEPLPLKTVNKQPVVARDWAEDAYPARAQAILNSARPLELDEEPWLPRSLYFAQDLSDISNKKCASPFITWAPKGSHCVNGRWVRINFNVAATARRSLEDALHAHALGGEHPYIDLDHLGLRTGTPIDFSYDDSGVVLLARLNRLADESIVKRLYTSFSPFSHWGGDEKFNGLGPNCGALLSIESRPAFREMPALRVCTKRKALLNLEQYFYSKVRSEMARLEGAGEKQGTALKATNKVAAQFPMLDRARQYYALLRKEGMKIGKKL